MEGRALDSGSPLASASGDPTRSGGRGTLLVLLAILALGTALRLLGLGFGQPAENTRLDELVALQEALALIEGDPHVHFHLYGSFLAKVQVLWLRGARALGLAPELTLVELHLAPGRFYVVVRALTVLFGVATIAVLYALGRRLMGRGAGLVAAAALAVLPIHVLHSHFATSDVPAVFFMFVSLLFAARAHGKREQVREIALAGIAAALAASCKYPTGAVVLVPAMIALASPRRVLLLLVLGLSFGAALALAYPDLLLAPQSVLDGLLLQQDAQAGLRGRWAHEHPLLFHLRYSLGLGSGITIGAVAVLGLVLAAIRRPKLLVYALPGLLILLVHGFFGAIFSRYVLPLAPLLALFVPAGLSALRRPGWPGWKIALVAAVLLLPAWRSLQASILLTRLDTRAELLLDFIDGELPVDLPILVPRRNGLALFPVSWDTRTLRAEPPDIYWDCAYRDGLVAKTQAGLLASGRPGVRKLDIHWFAPEEMAQTLAGVGGRRVLLLLGDCYHEEFEWVRELRELLVDLDRRGVVQLRRLRTYEPNGGGPLPPVDCYDPVDYCFVCLGDPFLVERPGPRLEVYEVRLPEIPAAANLK